MEKRQEILDATLKLSNEIGLMNVSTKLITKEANVGMGTIYRYFENKDQLLHQLFNQLSDKLNELIVTNFSITKGAYENFEYIVSKLMRYYTGNIFEFKYLGMYSESVIEIPNRLDDYLLKLMPIIKILGGKNLRLKDLPMQVIFALVYGPLISIVNLIHMGKLELSDELIKKVAKSCWDSITEHE